MSSEKTDAIVLRVIEFSETSCIVKLFTRDFGKISGLAKGARRPKSSFEAALDLLARIRLVFIRKSSDALDLLTEAKLERPFRSASRDLKRLYAGYYVAELLNELTDEGDPHPELFDAADATLVALDEDKELDGDARRQILRFEMTSLTLLGHIPSLDACAGCGKPTAIAARNPFGLAAGGVLCDGCRPGQRQIVSISGDVLQTMIAFTRIDNDAWLTTPLENATWGELRGVMNLFISDIVGKKLRMHAFVGNL